MVEETMLLNVEKIDTYYDIFQAIFKVSLNVQKEEVVCLLGRNGAGKTTTLASIVGLNRPRFGSVQLKGREITGLKSYQIVKLGIGFVPEHRWIFSDLTVKENLELGRREKKHKMMFEEIYHLFPKLRDLENQKGGTLSGGEQQMLAMGRGLMAIPKLLMLDEPSLGLAPIMVKTIFEAISRINRAGTTILLVEQDVKKSLSLASRGYVMENGKITLQGEAQELLNNEHLKKAYLGI